MKTLITLLFSLVVTLSFAQKRYKFDYAIETEITFFKEDSLKKQVIYLTNSKDNSYFAKITIKDSLKYQMIFKHHDSLYSDVLVVKSELNQAEYINISCDNIVLGENRYKNATKRYDFVLRNDTLINQKKYTSYKLICNLKLKKKLRRSAGSNLYIIDPSTSFHLPILTHPTAYEEWKIQKKLTIRYLC